MVPATTGAAGSSSRHGASGLTTAPRSCSDARSGGCWTPETKREFEFSLRRSGGGAVLTGPWLLGRVCGATLRPWLCRRQPDDGLSLAGNDPGRAAARGGGRRRSPAARRAYAKRSPDGGLGLFRQFRALGGGVGGTKDRRPGAGEEPQRRAAGGGLVAPASAVGVAMRRAGAARKATKYSFRVGRYPSPKAARRQVCLRNVERQLTRALHASLCGERTPRPRAAGVEAG